LQQTVRGHSPGIAPGITHAEVIEDALEREVALNLRSRQRSILGTSNEHDR